jgi:ATP-dependent DNA helicase RecG
MTRAELERLLQHESNAVEWKATGDPEKIVRTLTAFANDYEEAGGGTVICGVSEARIGEQGTQAVLVGIAPAELERLKDRVFNLSRTVVNPPLSPQIERVRVETDKEALVAWAPASSDIHAFQSNIVVRLGDKVTTATTSQVAELALKKAHLDWLAQPCPGATLDDIDLFALEDLARRMRVPAGPSELLRPGFRVTGSALPLISQMRTPTGTQPVPNRFAVLLVGREPHRFMPGAYVSITRFRGVTRADEIFFPGDIYGPIPYLVQKVMGMLETDATYVTDKSQRAQQGGQNRQRYSRQALHELLVNALAHRDYRSEHSTKIYIFSDRLEFESPGSVPDNVSLAELKTGLTRWRNPSLARYLFELGLAQERGTGIPKIVQETVAVAGQEPRFDLGSWFRVTIPAFQPALLKSNVDRIGLQAGVLVISIGYDTIDPDIIRRSHPDFERLEDDRLRSFEYGRMVAEEQWQVVYRELRDWLRDCLEMSQFKEFHVFYRGPLAFGPLIGALAVGRKPVVIYYFDEEDVVYRSAYRIDRRLRQAD